MADRGHTTKFDPVKIRVLLTYFPGGKENRKSNDQYLIGSINSTSLTNIDLLHCLADGGGRLADRRRALNAEVANHLDHLSGRFVDFGYLRLGSHTMAFSRMVSVALTPARGRGFVGSSAYLSHRPSG